MEMKIPPLMSTRTARAYLPSKRHYKMKMETLTSVSIFYHRGGVMDSAAFGHAALRLHDL